MAGRLNLLCELVVIGTLGVFLLYLFSRLTWGNTVRPTAQPTASSQPVLDNSPKRVFVTGAAGFIGFHLSLALSADKHFVVAMDNFNDYYDVKLKRDRAHHLHQKGIQVYYDDLCNTDFLEDVFARYNFTHVAHMAAQAGVRYSLENPLAYVRANVECQLALLDILKKYPHVKLVYASSSSVYGKNSKIPFQLSAKTDNPGNMYAATKKTDELLGYHYCETYQISAVGLRFFTVYGPWGRPDMAIYIFAQSILDGVDVPMFFVSDDNPLARDFTYVDDVINGVIAALSYKPTECGERFNLGFGHPVSVPGLVDILQDELGVPAKVKKLPLPPTEILRTWADIKTSTQFLGFKPVTDLKRGVRKFVTWYKGYRKQRSDEKASGLPSLAEKWFDSLIADKNRRAELYESDAHTTYSHQLMQRLQHEREKYYTWAKAHGREVPMNVTKEQFIFFQGMDSPKGDLLNQHTLKDNIKALKQRCLEIEQCVAFNSDGMLKRQVQERSKWIRKGSFRRSIGGLYVADIDVCKAELHDCARHALCTPISPGQYKCACKDGFYGNGFLCLPRYGQTETKELKREYLADYYNFYSIADMKQGKEMIYFEGVDSPGGDYLAADMHKGDHPTLKKICSEDPLCVAINTNGLMKHRVAPKKQWKKAPGGIYIYDINYCLLDDTDCPAGASCEKKAPGISECVKNPPTKKRQQLNPQTNHHQDTRHKGVETREKVADNDLPRAAETDQKLKQQGRVVKDTENSVPEDAKELPDKKDAIQVVMAVDSGAVPGG